MKVRFARTCSNAVMPKKAYSTDAGFDLTATSKEFFYPDVDINCVLYDATYKFKYYQYCEYDTGIIVEIPEGYVGLVFPRSSISKKEMALCNAVGVIDSHYRDTIKLRFTAKSMFGNNYEVGDKIGQLIIMRLPEIELEETDELSKTDRGTNGFGSSGS